MRSTARLALALAACSQLLACAGPPEDDAEASSAAATVDEGDVTPRATTCTVGAPTKLFDILDLGEVRAVAEREYGDNPGMVAALVGGLEALPKEQFPVTFLSVPVASSTRTVHHATEARAVGKVWRDARPRDLGDTAGADGVYRAEIPFAFYKDRPLERSTLTGDASFAITVRCGEGALAKSVRRTVVHPVIEEFYCANVESARGERTAICSGGCGTRSNVKDATVDWSSAETFQYSDSASEQRHAVQCICEDGKTFRVTCHGGEG